MERVRGFARIRLDRSDRYRAAISRCSSAVGDRLIDREMRLALARQRARRAKPFRAVMHVRERHVSHTSILCCKAQHVEGSLPPPWPSESERGATATKKKRGGEKRTKNERRTLRVYLPPPPPCLRARILENTIRVFLDERERRLDFSTGGNLTGASRCCYTLRSKKM